MIDGVREDIYTLVNASAGAGGLHYVQAKQGVSFPYTVFMIYAAPVNKDTVKKHYEFYVQFTAYGEGQTADQTESQGYCYS